MITKVDDQLITGADSLVATIRSYRPGDEVTVTYEPRRRAADHRLTLDSDAAASQADRHAGRALAPDVRVPPAARGPERCRASSAGTRDVHRSAILTGSGAVAAARRAWCRLGDRGQPATAAGASGRWLSSIARCWLRCCRIRLRWSLSVSRKVAICAVERRLLLGEPVERRARCVELGGLLLPGTGQLGRGPVRLVATGLAIASALACAVATARRPRSLRR